MALWTIRAEAWNWTFGSGWESSSCISVRKWKPSLPQHLSCQHKRLKSILMGQHWHKATSSRHAGSRFTHAEFGRPCLLSVFPVGVFPPPCSSGKQLPWLWIGGSYKCRELINYSGMLERYAVYTAGKWATISPRYYYCFHKHCRNLDESNYSCSILPLQSLCFWGAQWGFLAHPCLYFTHSCILVTGMMLIFLCLDLFIY